MKRIVSDFHGREYAFASSIVGFIPFHEAGQAPNGRKHFFRCQQIVERYKADAFWDTRLSSIDSQSHREFMNAKIAFGNSAPTRSGHAGVVTSGSAVVLALVATNADNTDQGKHYA